MCVRVFVLLLCLLSIQGGRLFAGKRKCFPEILRVDSLVREEKCVVVKGVVCDAQGEAIVGVNIIEKGTMNGVTTDRRGKFSLEVDLHGTLIVSFVGYRTRIIPVEGRTDFVITLEHDYILLDDVIVTALGLQKKESALSYAAIQVDKDELVRVKNPNMIVALMGKVAGMQVNRSSSGMGGAVKVVMRGNRSVAGNNQPLYVIDGVPMLNESSEQPYTAIGGTADAGNRDAGDGISNLNPEDIESISILKGAPAAALYGTQAANGVILITTKKGLAGKQEVAFTSSVAFDKAMMLPKLQNHYGMSDEIESWGERENITTGNPIPSFFRTGVTAIHSLSFMTGNERVQTYFSYANTMGKGILGKHELSKHNINFRETATFYEGRLKIDGNVNLLSQHVKNRPVPGGFYMNPLVGLYRFPRGMDITEYKEHFEVWSEERHLNVQNWHAPTEDFEQNPYWIQERITSRDQRTRAIVSLALNLKITNCFSVQARGNVDYVNDKFRQKYYASTAPALAGNNGRYIDSGNEQVQTYGDVIGTYKGKFSDFSLDVSLGVSISRKKANELRYDSKTASLKFANVFNIANINMNTSAYISEQIDAIREMQSLFITTQIGFRDYLFLDVSARNDWSSTLAYTSRESRGFFYPSIGVSCLMNRVLKLPEQVTSGKVRVAWSKVGNDIPLYITNPVAHVLAGGGIQASDAASFEEMKPEMSLSVEVGTEWKFFDSRLHIDFTYYQTHTKNQFFKLPAKDGDEYAYRYVNAGNIQNTGVELMIEGTPVEIKNFSWKTGINYAFNKNKVVRLHAELPVFQYGPYGFSSSYAMKLKKGGSFGDIYGKAFKRDTDGKILYETDGERQGLPMIEGDGNTVKVGNANPDFTLGWTNTFSWKGLVLSLLVDGRYGGKVLSQTQADMDMYGVTKVTGDARDRGYVMLEGEKITNVKGFYKSIVGGRAGVTEYYMYDATNFRLRELALGYTFPKRWMEATKFFRDVQLAFTARNLFFIYKEAPFDPDLILSTGNDNQAIEVYGMPTTRSMGFSLRVMF
ncbi:MULTISPECIES: SusC/RagA family TonB-linked outer membrane protein [Butyricimonas]|jgi:TonB-linked SusC/RagA family outer membrane protein|uniref:SusC/RagA family TonB-linked outer membrane protein n=1 Tax=Butyricimonas virosa TaxID=544645 RepID=A0ABX7H3M5_9BACT|nr:MULTISPECIES: SusC/RagA family TonB-linked outer membrane protein [Butyricimonas]MBO4959036.1 SusC/RagA family TonB-linked outer membrane protein [Butyricimonas sp.]MCI7294925.1 SusC/RagA family TonB-linked outer membrane protein [Butyricimonas virosa]MDY6217239.1 SusC/RagA family TonB-linked outer membrane protein [Butyricimonas virosa]QRO49622.1 SusC/RagA family TonB-linked outer membrane protein [Butyricimonas virosa]UWO45962.1 SusC/RagA family TonB-linked outer membrane protein [Butyric